MFPFPMPGAARARFGVIALTLAIALASGCSRDDKKAAERPPVDVTVLTVAPRDTPVSATYAAQTQSSQAVVSERGTGMPPLF